MFKKKPELKVLVVGLDNSGKTTIIERMKKSKAKTTPTVGFEQCEFAYSNVNLTVVDMSGAARYRALWEHHSSDAIIFVVDTSDRLRMCVAKNELEELFTARLPLLVLANKIDKGDVTPTELSTLLELQRYDRPWHVAPCNGLTGHGIFDAIDWLVAHTKS